MLCKDNKTHCCHTPHNNVDEIFDCIARRSTHPNMEGSLGDSELETGPETEIS